MRLLLPLLFGATLLLASFAQAEQVVTYRLQRGDQLNFVSYLFYGTIKKVAWVKEDNPWIEHLDKVPHNKEVFVRDLPSNELLLKRQKKVRQWRAKMGLKPGRDVLTRITVREAEPVLADKVPDWKTEYKSEDEAIQAGLLMASKAFNAGRPGKAEEYYLSLDSAFPNSYLVPFSVGRLYEERGEPEKAEAFYVESTKRNTNHFASHLNLLILYRKLNKSEDALSISKTIRERFPGPSQTANVKKWLVEEEQREPAKEKDQL